MTFFSKRRGIGPFASAAATALLFTAVLWVQHNRSGWPFAPAAATPPIERMVGMEPTRGGRAQPGTCGRGHHPVARHPA